MRVAIVTADLRIVGGVREKALFVARTLRDQLGASVQVVSLATSRTRRSSILLHQPRTWGRSLVSRYTVDEFTVDHVGAVGAEIEMARYGGRRAILKSRRGVRRPSRRVRDSGLGACRQPVSGPVIVHFASFVRHERRRDDSGPMSPSMAGGRVMTAAVGHRRTCRAPAR